MKLSGIKAHLWQRISAWYLLFYFPYLAWAFFSAKQNSHSLETLNEQLFNLFFSTTTLIAIALIISHAWVGVRDIMIDYLPDSKVGFWLTAYAVFLTLIVLDLIWLSYLAFG